MLELNLTNKNILLALSGSISIYKSLELLRLFTKSGANVKVLMSDEAKNFINPICFEALSSNEVLSSTNQNWHSGLNHIAYAKVDAFVLAPATANTINKLSMGIADNILLQTALAYNKPMIIAPSANTNMIKSNTSKRAIKLLKEDGHIIVEPELKTLICNTKGVGALADEREIYYATCRELSKDSFWLDKKVIVTGGGSIEKIDEVRYISNFSSAKMASALALSLYIKGAKLSFISSRFPQFLPKSIRQISYLSSKELKEKIDECVKDSSYIFMAAAVSDFLVRQNKAKIKKENFNKNLELSLNEDIIAKVKGLKKIGFKAEFDEKNALSNAKKALIEKDLDVICLNILKNSDSFGTDYNELRYISKNKEKLLSRDTKFNLAFNLIGLLKDDFK